MLDIDNRSLNWLLVFNFHSRFFFMHVDMCCARSGDWWAEQSDRNKSIFFFHLHDPLSQVLDFNIYSLMILIGTCDLLPYEWGLSASCEVYKKKVSDKFQFKILSLKGKFDSGKKLRTKREKLKEKPLGLHTSFIIRSTSSLTIAFSAHFFCGYPVLFIIIY